MVLSFRKVLIQQSAPIQLTALHRPRAGDHTVTMTTLGDRDCCQPIKWAHLMTFLRRTDVNQVTSVWNSSRITDKSWWTVNIGVWHVGNVEVDVKCEEFYCGDGKEWRDPSVHSKIFPKVQHLSKMLSLLLSRDMSQFLSYLVILSAL